MPFGNVVGVIRRLRSRPGLASPYSGRVTGNSDRTGREHHPIIDRWHGGHRSWSGNRTHEENAPPQNLSCACQTSSTPCFA